MNSIVIVNEQMLKMVISNIINHPNEMKYCKIKKDNVKLQERILKVYMIDIERVSFIENQV